MRQNLFILEILMLFCYFSRLKSQGKQGGLKVKRYKPELKAKIISAAKEARSAGKSWNDAHNAAKEAGYKGSLNGLAAMVTKAGGKVKVKGKRGRKAGKRTYAKSDPITKFVNQMVEQKLKERVKAAIRALKGI